MAIEGKGRWVTIAGRHIFVEEGETPMSAYVRTVAGKKTSVKQLEKKRQNAEEKAKNQKEINDAWEEAKKRGLEIDKAFGEDKMTREQLDVERQKRHEEEQEKRHKATEERVAYIDRFSTDKYKHLEKEYEEDQARRNKERVVKIGGENVIVKGDETPIEAFIKKKVGDRPERKHIYSKTEWEQARADFEDKAKELSRTKNTTSRAVDVNSSNINEAIEKAKSPTKATKILNEYLNKDTAEGMNARPKYEENKYGVKDQALLHDENERPSNSWIPTRQAMITYYKKRAKEENNKYYSDNAERLADEYIKYREELKKKGRN